MDSYLSNFTSDTQQYDLNCSPSFACPKNKTNNKKEKWNKKQRKKKDFWKLSAITTSFYDMHVIEQIWLKNKTKQQQYIFFLY